MTRRTIQTDYLARVEGEGALFIQFDGDTVEDVKLRIFEPPRYFETLLKGRAFGEAPDITARICGICPVAYQMSAIHAIENAFGVTVDGQLRALRRLIYCGEWIESHVLHMYMLHAPDFLGYDSAIHMAKEHKDIVERGLQMKKAGNEIIRIVGGREIHPINLKVGGFYRAPDEKDLVALTDALKWARDAAAETVRWTADLEFPDFEQDYELVSLQHPDEYPMNEGRIVSSRGLDIAVTDYDAVFEESHMPHSTALHSRIKDRDTYLVGPMARFALNYEHMSPLAKDLASEVGLDASCRNPFRSIVVRAVEVLYAFDEALRLIEDYERPDRSDVPFDVVQATGFAATEAPRGLLYHRYHISEDGLIGDAQIVPPTSQNQGRIEQDLYAYADLYRDLPDDDLRWRCEQAVRNYDPCISCSTHFLDLTVVRT